MAPNGKPSEDVYFDKVATFNNYIWSQLVHTFVSFITRDNPEVFSQFHPIKQHPQSCFHNPQPFQTQISTLNMQIQIHIIRIWLKFSNIWLTIWPILPESLTKIWPFLTKIWPKYIVVLYDLYDLFVSLNLWYMFQKRLKLSIN